MMSNLNHTVMVPRTNGVFGLKLKAAEAGETIVREHLMYPMIQKGDIIVSGKCTVHAFVDLIIQPNLTCALS